MEGRLCVADYLVIGLLILPWYDNYCFAKECLESDIRVFNCDMVLYYLRNYISYKHSPEIMLDPNTKTDYKKLNMLIQLDKLDGNRHNEQSEK